MMRCFWVDCKKDGHNHIYFSIVVSGNEVVSRVGAQLCDDHLGQIRAEEKDGNVRILLRFPSMNPGAPS